MPAELGDAKPWAESLPEPTLSCSSCSMTFHTREVLARHEAGHARAQASRRDFEQRGEGVERVEPVRPAALSSQAVHARAERLRSNCLACRRADDQQVGLDGNAMTDAALCALHDEHHGRYYGVA